MSTIATGNDAWRSLVAMVETDMAQRHRLTFRHPVETVGNVWCWRCKAEITLRQVLAGERCPGREVAP